MRLQSPQITRRDPSDEVAALFFFVPLGVTTIDGVLGKVSGL